MSHASIPRTQLLPERLPGVAKRSFALPFHGGEIWFEHLDGMYQYADLTRAKLMADSEAFLRPSGTSFMAVVLFDTWLPEEVTSLMATLLCRSGRAFRRVCFVGAEPALRWALKAALGRDCPFPYAFLDDTEAAKEWLLP